MPRNGSGTYSLPAGNPVVTGTTISSTVQNNTMSDVATALTQSISSTGVTTPSANLPMGGFRHTNVGNAVSLTDYTSATDVQKGTPVTLTSVSGTNTITATAPYSMSSLSANQTFRFVSAGANTTAVTLNINGIGAKSITKFGTSPLNAGDIQSGAALVVYYDGTQFQLIGAPTSISVTRSVRTSNTILTSSDNSTLIEITSGTFSQTFSASSSLGSGWSVWYKNSGTGNITLTPNGAETIDGLSSFVMYPGEERRFTTNGSNLFSELITPGSIVYTSTSTFVAPPGVTGYEVDVIGAGGGGGSGRRGAAASSRTGGCGGGGGARIQKLIGTITAGTSITVTVGAGGNGGTAISADNTNGNAGTTGGTSSFGTYAYAYGGEGGSGGISATTFATVSTGAAGGGTGSAGGASALGTGAGGSPSTTNFGNLDQTGSGTTHYNTSGGGAGTSDRGNPGCAEWGGGAGGTGRTAGTGFGGGGSILGGCGGGSGGGIDSADVRRSGGTGGLPGAYVVGTGAAGGGDLVAGTAGTATTLGVGGGGGGGGGAGAAGGAGGAGGGGGGGGGASANGTASGAGAAGGRGEVRVYWW